MTEEKESYEALSVRAALQEKTIVFLQDAVSRKKRRIDALLGQVKQHSDVRDSVWGRYCYVVRRNMVLQGRLRRQWNGHLVGELDAAQLEIAELKKRNRVWRAFARRAAEAKAREATQRRDLEEVLEQLRKKLAEMEQQRDSTVTNAERLVNERTAQLNRHRDYCERWYKGDLGSTEVIAAIMADLNGYTMAAPSKLEKARAVQHAVILAQHREMSVQLTEIEALMNLESIDLQTTHVDMVKAYIARRDEENRHE